MPTTNARKHVIPSGDEQTISRETIFKSFANSIRDIVPVASITERSQLVLDLAAAGQVPSAARPLIVHRADAPGLHRLEYCTDSTGSVWLPASGTLFFANKAAADSFATSNGGLLTVGDVCSIAGVEHVWSGLAWHSQAWTVLTPASGWSAATGAIRYRRRLDTLEVLPVELIRTGNVGISPGANVTVATLPSGFRPSATQPLGAGSIGVAGNLGASRWFVNASGEIFFQSLVATGTMATGGGVTNHVQAGGGAIQVA